MLPYVSKVPRHLDDPWSAILDHMIQAREAVEDVYRLDLRGAFKKRDDQEARKLVFTRLAFRRVFCEIWLIQRGSRARSSLPQ